MALYMRLSALFAFFLATLCVSGLHAQSIPTSDEAQRVLNFYHNGKGDGIVLMESKICRDVHKSGATKYDCKNEVIEFGPLKDDGSPPDVFHKINRNETIYVWMAYLVPVGAQEKIYLRYNLNGETRRTSGELKVKGSIRYRTWSRFTPTKSGEWEIEIFHDGEAGPERLNTFTLTVE